VRARKLPRGIFVRHGNYGYSFSMNGQRVRRHLGPVTALTLDDAVAARNLAIGDSIRLGEAIPRPIRALTIRELLAKFAETHPLGTGRRQLLDNYFSHLMRVLGSETPVDRISHVTLVSYRLKRQLEDVGRPGPAKRVTASTINRELSALRAAFRWAETQRLPLGRNGNIFRRLSRSDRKTVFTREVSSAEPMRISDDDINKLCAAMPAPFRPLVRLAVLTGCRMNELVQLDWSEINLNSNPPYLRPRHTKNGKPRSVPLSKAALDVLPPCPAEGGRVFRGARGAPLQNLQRAWRRARVRAGLPKARFHDLRHEWASRFVEAGGDVRALMEVGGWGSLALVARYSHSNLARVAETMERCSTDGSKAEKSKIVRFTG
jgi:integrase